MKIYTLKFKQNIPIPVREAWNFFSSPHNLSNITPSLGFKIKTDIERGDKMYPGILISYTVSPLFGIKMDWLTEITHINDQEYFIDEQRFGPFKFWHHQHHFREISGGVEMIDILNYAIPYSLIGRIANQLFVNQKINKIFAFREQKINEIFGSYRPAL